MSELDQDPEKIHEGTEALKDLAEDVGREREERGRSDLDPVPKSDEQLMSDAAAYFEDNPDIDAENGENH
jgi:hypothetical protein